MTRTITTDDAPEELPTLPLFPEPPETAPEPELGLEPATTQEPEQPSARPSRRNELSPEEVAEILGLRARGLGSRQIAKATGRSRHAVRRALEGTKPAGESTQAASPPSAAASKLDPYRQRVQERVALGLTVVRILRELQEDGYTGGRTILSDYVRTLRAPLAPKARRVTRRFETERGEEAQVDWSTYRIEVGGKLTTVQALAVVLACSRYAFLRFYPSQRQALLLEGLEAAFQALGGVTRQVVFDNMATVVLGRVGKDRQPLWNPELVAFAQHYGFEPRVCRVADPNRKGEVEAFLGYAERDLVRGARPNTLAELNRDAQRWLEEIANRRLHGTTGRIPEEAWAEERPFLIALPDVSYPGACEQEYRRVAEDCTISIQGTRYTVPARLAHQQVRVRLYAERFEVLERGGAVALGRAYATGDEARRLQLDPAHYAELPRSRPVGGGRTQRLKEQVLTRWPALSAFVDDLHSRVKGLLHVHLRTLLRLAERYGEHAFEQATLRAHAGRRHTAQAVERILERDFQPLPDEALPLSGGAARAEALLGEVEEASLDSFAYLDGTASEGEDVAPDEAREEAQGER